MKEYILTLDPGKDSVKAMGVNSEDEIDSMDEVKQVCFKTRTYNLKNGYIDVQGNSHKVVYGDKELIVGEQGNDRSFNTSKTEFLHQISAYTAITQFLKPNSKDNVVNLGLACPITVLKSDVAKQEYKDLIKGDGPIKIEVDDKKYEFTINEILLKAEGSGILYLAPELFKKKKVAVVDFGGLNMTVTVFNNGTCVNPETDRFAEEHGQIALVNLMVSELTAYKNGNIVPYNVAEEALDRGYMLKGGKKDSESIEIINRAKQKFLQIAKTKMDSHGVNMDYLDNVIFIGGTTEHLREQISEIANAQTTDNSQWATTEGIFKVALKKFKK